MSSHSLVHLLRHSSSKPAPRAQAEEVEQLVRHRLYGARRQVVRVPGGSEPRGEKRAPDRAGPQRARSAG